MLLVTLFVLFHAALAACAEFGVQMEKRAIAAKQIVKRAPSKSKEEESLPSTNSQSGAVSAKGKDKDDDDDDERDSGDASAKGKDDNDSGAGKDDGQGIIPNDILGGDIFGISIGTIALVGIVGLVVWKFVLKK